MHSVLAQTPATSNLSEQHFIKSNAFLVLTFYNTIPNDLEERAFKNTTGEAENGSDQHFLLFPR